MIGASGQIGLVSLLLEYVKLQRGLCEPGIAEKERAGHKTLSQSPRSLFVIFWKRQGNVSNGWKKRRKFFQRLEKRGKKFPTIGKTREKVSNDWKGRADPFSFFAPGWRDVGIGS